MNLKQLVAAAATIAALGAATVGPASGIASADLPPPWWPGGPGRPHDGPPPGDWHDAGDWHDRGWNPGGPINDGHWWRDQPPWGDGPAPWGWGPPPRPDFYGPLPPPDGIPPAPFNYWGQTVTPVWDRGYNQWGFWFFGVWIPL